MILELLLVNLGGNNADIPLALMQQYGWAMINVRDNITQQKNCFRGRSVEHIVD